MSARTDCSRMELAAIDLSPALPRSLSWRMSLSKHSTGSRYDKGVGSRYISVSSIVTCEPLILLDRYEFDVTSGGIGTENTTRRSMVDKVVVGICVEKDVTAFGEIGCHRTKQRSTWRLKLRSEMELQRREEGGGRREVEVDER